MSGSSHFPSREVAPAPRAKLGACDGRRSGGIYSEFGVACDHIEVDVSMQDRRVGANGDRPDEAIHELTDRLSCAATLTIDGSRLLIVNGSSGKDSGSRQKSTELMQMVFVTRSCKYLHPNRVADSHIFCEQPIDSIANR